MKTAEPSESRPLVHLCAYWNTSSVHAALTGALADALACPQVVFVPCRTGVAAPAYAPANGVRVLLLPVLNNATRLLYPLKLRRVLRAARATMAHEGIEPLHVHGHTIYADGVAARFLARDAGCTYSLSVRGTDVNLGTRWHAWAASLVRRTLADARSVMLLSPTFATPLIARLGLRSPPRLHTLASGLDAEFCRLVRRTRDRTAREPAASGPVRLLADGKTRNKNLDGVCEACLLLVRRGGLAGRPLEVEAFGIEPAGLARVVSTNVLRRVAAEPRLQLRAIGRLEGRDAMARAQSRADVFVMPSRSESFGLTYLEAIGMCTPVVYSRGQGIDGLFDEIHVGAAVDSGDAADIARGIESCVERFPHGLGPFEENPVTSFTWPAVAAGFVDALRRGGVALPRRRPDRSLPPYPPT